MIEIHHISVSSCPWYHNKKASEISNPVDEYGFNVVVSILVLSWEYEYE